MDFLLRMTLNSFSSSIIGARGDGWHGAVVAAPCLPLRRLSLRRLRHQSTWRFLSRRRAATPPPARYSWRLGRQQVWKR